jgi:two-component sensor histidine kinase
VVVPHHARAARLVRYRLGEELGGMVAPELLADAIAVVAELVGNAVRHAQPLPGGVIRVSWRLDGRLDSYTDLVVRVTDSGGLKPPREQHRPPDSIDGRGLRIVAALAERWGVEHDEVGQSVWARLRGPAPSPRRSNETASRDSHEESAR